MKILGMGNALVDIMTRLTDDSILAKFRLPKGSMTLVDRELSNFIHVETARLRKNQGFGRFCRQYHSWTGSSWCRNFLYRENRPR